MRRRSVVPSFSLHSVVFILSNNHINSIITAPLDFHDEDIVSQYISFMKMLSLTINERTIRFFHNEVLHRLRSDVEKQGEPVPSLLHLLQVLRPPRRHGSHRHSHHHVQLSPRFGSSRTLTRSQGRPLLSVYESARAATLLPPARLLHHFADHHHEQPVQRQVVMQ